MVGAKGKHEDIHLAQAECRLLQCIGETVNTFLTGGATDERYVR